MRYLEEYMKRKASYRPKMNPVLIEAAMPTPFNPYAPAPGEKPQLPQVDTSNPIGSIAEILGPTPAEREARERRAMKSKAKMSAWAGLFDGLRQFGNLYSVYKGATPQQLSSPYQTINDEVNQQRAIADANDNYRRQYAQSLYNFRRQMSDDARRDMLAKAQADYYGTRDEVTRMKAENDRQKLELDKLKAVKVIKQKDGSLMKFDPVSGNVEPLTEADPLYQEYVRSQINRNNRVNAGGGARNNAGTTRTTTVDYDENGNKRTTTVTTPNNASGNKGGGSKGALLPGTQANKDRRGSLLP